MLRFAQHDKVMPVMTRVYPVDGCHPECNEGSSAWGTEMLRFAQHDKVMPVMTALHFVDGCHLECTEGLAREAPRCFAALSMTRLCLSWQGYTLLS